MRLAILLLVVISVDLRALDLEQQTIAIQERIQASDLTGAAREIASALGTHPRAGGLFNLRGIVHAQRNELGAARADFARAVRFSPALVPAWANLAHACRMAEGNDAACSVSVWHLLTPSVATALAKRDDYSEGDFVAVSEALRDRGSALTVVTLANQLDARHVAGPATLRAQAIALEQLNQLTEARKALERVAILDPKNIAHLLELARLADLGGDEEGAVGYLAHARDIEPGNARIHYLFAMIASKMNLPVEARASLDRALAIEPQNPSFNYAMGYVLLSTRDAATAGTYFQKYVAAKPENIRGHYALGIAYYASGDYAKSKIEMDRARNDASTAGGAEYFLGRIARQEDDLQAAAQHLRRSIELLPRFAESHTELARVLMSEQDLPAARVELERALTIDRNSFQANTQLLVIYRRTKDARAAEQETKVKRLDEQRSKRAELMLRTIEVRP